MNNNLIRIFISSLMILGVCLNNAQASGTASITITVALYCTPGDTLSCNTDLPGICADGTQICDEAGYLGECVRNNQPCEEICDDNIDNDCDGETDEDVSCLSPGDVNGDGAITPGDALMAFQYYLGGITLDECQKDRAEVNKDGSITPADALCIFQKYLKLPLSCLD